MAVEASPAALEAGRRLQRAVRVAVAELRAVRERLLYDLAEVAPAPPPLVDGRPAGCDLVEWVRDRVEDTCLKGSLADAIRELELEVTIDQLSRLADYWREVWGDAGSED